MSREEFLELVKKSGVISAETLQPIVAKTSDLDAPKTAAALIRAGLLTNWQAKYLLSGRHYLKVNNYVLLKRVRRDQLGDTFLADHLGLRRKVNIQFLPASMSSDKEQRQRFIQRVALAAELDHRNLVHVYDVDQERGRYYLISEFINKSVMLADVEPDNERQLVGYVGQAMRGLLHAHENGVVHGSLAPSSLLIAPDQTVKIDNIVLSALSSNEPLEPNQDYHGLGRLALEKLASVPNHNGVVKAAFQELSETEDAKSLLSRFDELSQKDPVQQALPEKHVVNETIAIKTVRRKKAASNIEGGKENETNPKPATPQKPKPRPNGQAPASDTTFHPKVVFGVILGLAAVLFLATTMVVMWVVSPPANEVANENQPRRISQRPRDDQAERLDQRFAVDDTQDLATQVAMIPVQGDETQGTLQTPPPKASEQNPVEPQKTPPTNETPVGEPKSKAPQLPPKTETKAESPKNAVTTNNPKPKPDTGSTTQSAQGAINDGQEAEAIKSTNPPPAKTNQPTSNNKPTNQPPGNANKTKPGGEQQSKGNNSKKTPKKNAPNPNPFKTLGESVEIPSNTETTKVPLGKITSVKGHYLSMKLQTGPGIAKSKINLELKPDHKKDLRRWQVVYKKRASQPEVAVAEFSRDENEGTLFFQWLAAAADEKKLNYLRNGLVHFVYSDKHKATLRLRKLIQIKGFQISQEKPEIRLEIDAPWLPNQNMISVELQDLPEKKFGKTIVEETVIKRKEPVRIFFSEIDYEQMSSVMLSADIRSKIKLYAALQIHLGDGKSAIAKQKLIESTQAGLVQYSQANKAEYNQFKGTSLDNIRRNLKRQKLIKADNEYTWEMKKDRESKLKTLMDVSAERASKFNKQATESIPKFWGADLPVIVTYKLGKREIPLASTISN